MPCGCCTLRLPRFTAPRIAARSGCTFAAPAATRTLQLRTFCGSVHSSAVGSLPVPAHVWFTRFCGSFCRLLVAHPVLCAAHGWFFTRFNTTLPLRSRTPRRLLTVLFLLRLHGCHVCYATASLLHVPVVRYRVLTFAVTVCYACGYVYAFYAAVLLLCRLRTRACRTAHATHARLFLPYRLQPAVTAVLPGLWVPHPLAVRYHTYHLSLPTTTPPSRIPACGSRAYTTVLQFNTPGCLHSSTGSCCYLVPVTYAFTHGCGLLQHITGCLYYHAVLTATTRAHCCVYYTFSCRLRTCLVYTYLPHGSILVTLVLGSTRVLHRSTLRTVTIPTVPRYRYRSLYRLVLYMPARYATAGLRFSVLLPAVAIHTRSFCRSAFTGFWFGCCCHCYHLHRRMPRGSCPLTLLPRDTRLRFLVGWFYTRFVVHTFTTRTAPRVLRFAVALYRLFTATCGCRTRSLPARTTPVAPATVAWFYLRTYTFGPPHTLPPPFACSSFTRFPCPHTVLPFAVTYAGGCGYGSAVTRYGLRYTLPAGSFTRFYTVHPQHYCYLVAFGYVYWFGLHLSFSRCRFTTRLHTCRTRLHYTTVAAPFVYAFGLDFVCHFAVAGLLRTATPWFTRFTFIGLQHICYGLTFCHCSLDYGCSPVLPFTCTVTYHTFGSHTCFRFFWFTPFRICAADCRFSSCRSHGCPQFCYPPIHLRSYAHWLPFCGYAVWVLPLHAVVQFYRGLRFGWFWICLHLLSVRVHTPAFPRYRAWFPAVTHRSAHFAVRSLLRLRAHAPTMVTCHTLLPPLLRSGTYYTRCSGSAVLPCGYRFTYHTFCTHALVLHLPFPYALPLDAVRYVGYRLPVTPFAAVHHYAVSASCTVPFGYCHTTHTTRTHWFGWLDVLPATRLFWFLAVAGYLVLTFLFAPAGYGWVLCSSRFYVLVPFVHTVRSPQSVYRCGYVTLHPSLVTPSRLYVLMPAVRVTRWLLRTTPHFAVCRTFTRTARTLRLRSHTHLVLLLQLHVCHHRSLRFGLPHLAVTPVGLDYWFVLCRCAPAFGCCTPRLLILVLGCGSAFTHWTRLRHAPYARLLPVLVLWLRSLVTCVTHYVRGSLTSFAAHTGCHAVFCRASIWLPRGYVAAAAVAVYTRFTTPHDGSPLRFATRFAPVPSSFGAYTVLPDTLSSHTHWFAFYCVRLRLHTRVPLLVYGCTVHTTLPPPQFFGCGSAFYLTAGYACVLVYARLQLHSRFCRFGSARIRFTVTVAFTAILLLPRRVAGCHGWIALHCLLLRFTLVHTRSFTFTCGCSVCYRTTPRVRYGLHTATRFTAVYRVTTRSHHVCTFAVCFWFFTATSHARTTPCRFTLDAYRRSCCPRGLHCTHGYAVHTGWLVIFILRTGSTVLPGYRLVLLHCARTTVAAARFTHRSTFSTSSAWFVHT